MSNTIVGPNSPGAGSTVPSRDMDANFGTGTARRETPNMLPVSRTRVRLAGKTQPQWAQSRAMESKRGVLPQSKPMSVFARSGNQDGAAVGLAPQGMALMGGQSCDTLSADAVAESQDNTKKVIGIGLLAGLAYLFLR